MNRRRWLVAAGALLLAAALAFGITWGLERLFTPGNATTVESAPPSEPASTVPHITATLFYVTADGQALVGVRREVPLAGNPVDQGRQILDAQLGNPAPDLVAAIPAGTSVRAFYISERSDAFVDLSAEIAANHPRGSTAELLTVYAVVNAVTANLPAIQRVQILIDGKEVDTLAGHVDLRRPLARDDSLVRSGQ